MKLAYAVRAVGLFSLLLAAGCGSGGGSDPDAGLPPADATGTGTDATGSGTDAGGTGTDAAPPPVMSISEIIPAAASRLVDTTVTVLGRNLAAGATFVLDNCDTATTYDLSGSVTVAGDGLSLTADLPMDQTREQGIYTVTIQNPDGQSDTLLCAFRILASQPPTVTDVVQPTAFAGAPADGISSDSVVTITGTGFEPTPAVRWVKTDGSVSYDALFVGFNSATQLTTIVPAETLSMTPGDYHVFVNQPGPARRPMAGR